MPDPRPVRRASAAMVLPSDAAIERIAPSIRRTSHVDMIPAGDGLVLRAGSRDLRTTSADSTPTLAGELRLLARVDETGVLASIEVEPDDAGLDDLRGRSINRGFRRAVADALPDQVARSTLLAGLLDDLPVAAMLSGYARMYLGQIRGDITATEHTRGDICSGWRSTGTMMTTLRSTGSIPVTIGPTAPAVATERLTDPLAWHDLADLGEGSMRRRRLLDVRSGPDSWIVTAMFRDSHAQPDGVESVLHEYTLSAVVDIVSGRFVSCDAVPRVLPFVECPVAAASAGRLVGRHVSDVAGMVRGEFRGTSTCTHLNDLLCSLAAVTALAARLGPTPA